MMRALVGTVADPGFGTFSLLFLLSFFVALFWLTYLVTPKSVHDKHAMLPFSDETNDEKNHGDSL